jgi:transposase InsO family protein
MAQDNPRWGYTRIQGALGNLSHKVGRGTIANVLKRNGIEPSPARSKRTPWSTFLKAHWKVLAASDFLTVEVWTGRGLVTYYLLFVISLADRVVNIRLPPMSPNLNAYAERFVRSIKEECLNRMIFIGQASLRSAVAEYTDHYHRERNHQGLDNRLIHAPAIIAANDGAIHRHMRLGGTLNFYYRKAA